VTGINTGHCYHAGNGPQSKVRLAIEPGGNIRYGAGLGLAVCKAIVEAHGGSISVDTEFAKGTKFTVLLP